MKSKLLFLSLLFATFARPLIAQNDCEQCRQILENGIYNTFKFDKSIDLKKQFVNYLKSDEFFTYALHQYQTSNFGLSAIVEGVPVGMSFDQLFTQDQNSTYKKFLEQFQSQSYSYQETENIYSQFVEPSIVAAWRDCINNTCSQTKIKSSYQSISDKEVRITLDPKFNSTNSKYVIQDVVVRGGKISPEYASAIKKGKRITGKYEFNINRDNASTPLNFIINVDCDHDVKTLNILVPASYPKYSNVIVFKGDTVLNKDVSIKNADLVIFYKASLFFDGNNPDNSPISFTVDTKNLLFVGSLTISGKGRKGETGSKGADCSDFGTKYLCEGDCNATRNQKPDRIPGWTGGKGGAGGKGYSGATVKITTVNLLSPANVNGGKNSLAGGDGGDGGSGGDGVSCYNQPYCYGAGNAWLIWKLDGPKGDKGTLGDSGSFQLDWQNPKTEVTTLKQ